MGKRRSAGATTSQCDVNCVLVRSRNKLRFNNHLHVSRWCESCSPGDQGELRFVGRQDHRSTTDKMSDCVRLLAMPRNAKNSWRVVSQEHSADLRRGE